VLPWRCGLPLWCLYSAARTPFARLCGQITLMWAHDSVPFHGAHRCASSQLQQRRDESPRCGWSGRRPLPSAAELASRSASVAVSIYDYNSFFVCWSGSHRGPGILAAVMIPLYVLGLPLVTLWWLWRDPWVRAQARATASRTVYRTVLFEASPTPAPAEATHSTINPMGVPHAFRHTRAATAAAAANMRWAPEPDPLLGSSFTTTSPPLGTRSTLISPSCCCFLCCGRWCSDPRASAPSSARQLLFVSLSGLPVVHVLWVRPYLEADAWMGWVRVLLLLDSLAITLLNAVASAVAVHDSPSLAATLGPGSYVVFCMCVGTLVALLVGFGWHAFKSAGVRAEGSRPGSSSCGASAARGPEGIVGGLSCSA